MSGTTTPGPDGMTAAGSVSIRETVRLVLLNPFDEIFLFEHDSPTPTVPHEPDIAATGVHRRGRELEGAGSARRSAQLDLAARNPLSPGLEQQPERLRIFHVEQ